MGAQETRGSHGGAIVNIRDLSTLERVGNVTTLMAFSQISRLLKNLYNAEPAELAEHS